MELIHIVTMDEKAHLEEATFNYSVTASRVAAHVMLDDLASKGTTFMSKIVQYEPVEKQKTK